MVASRQPSPLCRLRAFRANSVLALGPSKGLGHRPCINHVSIRGLGLRTRAGRASYALHHGRQPATGWRGSRPAHWCVGLVTDRHQRAIAKGVYLGGGRHYAVSSRNVVNGDRLADRASPISFWKPAGTGLSRDFRLALHGK